MLARFLAGLPHGAYFGVASLVAAELAPAGPQGRAVALVMLGPLGRQRRRRARRDLAGPARSAGASAYWAVAVLGAAHRRAGRWRSCPSCPGDPEATGRRELRALRRAAGAG